MFSIWRKYPPSNKILKNTLSLGTGQVLTKLVSLVSIPIIARMLGLEKFGEYTLIFSFVVLFGGLSDWGIHKLTIREVAKDEKSTNIYFTNTLFLRIILAVFFYLLMIGVAILLNYSHIITNLIIILGPLILANSIVNTFVSLLNAQERMDISAILLFIQSLITPVTVIPLLYFGFNLKTIFIILVTANITLAILIGLLLMKRFFSFQLDSVNRETWKKIFIHSWPYALMAIVWMIYISNGSIILSKITDLSQVGLFNTSLKLILALFFIPGSLMMAFFPMMSRQITDQVKHNIKQSCEKSIKILLWIVLPLALLIFLFSNFFIQTLYGSEFIESAKVLKILSISLVLFFINSPLGYTILSSTKVKNYVIFDVLMVTANVFLAVILSIKYGFIGPALAILCTEALTLVIRLLFLKNYLLIKLSFRNIVLRNKPNDYVRE